MRAMVRIVREYAWLVLLGAFCVARGIAASGPCPAHEGDASVWVREPSALGYSLVVKLLDGAGKCAPHRGKHPRSPADPSQ